MSHVPIEKTCILVLSGQKRLRAAKNCQTQLRFKGKFGRNGKGHFLVAGVVEVFSRYELQL